MLNIASKILHFCIKNANLACFVTLNKLLEQWFDICTMWHSHHATKCHSVILTCQLSFYQ